LVNHPTSLSCFRDLTFYAHEFCHYNVIVEGEPKDIYYLFLKKRGAMDYVDDILLPGEEVGIRVDNDFTYAPTICVINQINARNLNYILNCIGFKGLVS
jgi:hypothetical protein